MRFQMKEGDLVRARKHVGPGKYEGNIDMGILIEYNTWEKVATVLLGSGLHRIRAEHVEKAGKKDGQPK